LFSSKRPGFLRENAPDFIIEQQLAEMLEALRQVILDGTNRGLGNADAMRTYRAYDMLNSEGVAVSRRPVNETLGVEIETVRRNKHMHVPNHFKDIHSLFPCVSMEFNLRERKPVLVNRQATHFLTFLQAIKRYRGVIVKRRIQTL
tara:strand:- start:62 stop:499 length:438 start_codon:yes stop_codon:yes gene_type:complete